jgi:hypothetical protein
MKLAKLFIISTVLAMTACGQGRSGLAEAIDPETGSFEKFRAWKAENGKYQLYGVDIRTIRVWKSETSNKLETVAIDTESNAKLSEIRNATAKLCHINVSNLENSENNIVYYGTVRRQLGSDVVECGYSKRHSDGLGSITFARNPTN